MPDSVLTPPLRAEIERLGRADIMVGIPSYRNAATIGHVVRAAQAGLVQYFPDLRPVLVNSDAGSPDGTQRVVAETEPPDYVERILLVRPTNRLERLTLTYPDVDGVGGKGAALRTIFEMAAALEVRALVVVDSRPALDRPRVDRAPRRAHPQGRLRLRHAPLRPPQVRRHDHEHRHLPADPGALRATDPPADRGRLRRVRGPGPPLPGARRTGPPDVSRFGIDIWMTTHGPHRRLRRLPGAPGREDPRPEGPVGRPRADVPPGRRRRSSTSPGATPSAWLADPGQPRGARLRVRADRRAAAAGGQHAPAPLRVPRRLADPRRDVGPRCSAPRTRRRSRTSPRRPASSPRRPPRAWAWAARAARRAAACPRTQMSEAVAALPLPRRALGAGRLRPASSPRGSATCPRSASSPRSCRSTSGGSAASSSRRAGCPGPPPRSGWSARPGSSSCASPTSSSAGRRRGGGGRAGGGGGRRDDRSGYGGARVTSRPPLAAGSSSRRQPGDRRGPRPHRRRPPRSADRRADRSRDRRGPGGDAALRGRHAGPPGPPPPPAGPRLRPGGHADPAARPDRPARRGGDRGGGRRAGRRPDHLRLGRPAPAASAGPAAPSSRRRSTPSSATPPCDIAVVKQRGRGEIRRILVPVRGGPHAELALEFADALARRHDARIVVLHVVPPGVTDAVRAQAERALADVRQAARPRPRGAARPRGAQRPQRDPARGREGRPRDHGRLGRARGDGRARPSCSAPCPEAIAARAKPPVIVVKTREPIGQRDVRAAGRAGRDARRRRARGRGGRGPSRPGSSAGSASRTSTTREFADLRRLVDLKEKQGLTVSLVLPTLNEEATIGPIVRRAPARPDGAACRSSTSSSSSTPASTDRTREIAAARGRAGRPAPRRAGPLRLATAARARRSGRASTRRAATSSSGPTRTSATGTRGWSTGRSGPLLAEPRIQYVKGYYQRPIVEGGVLREGGGGRVTELVARPLINLFFPELSGFIQPLAGEYAGRRSLLETIPFFTGYAVEIGHLIDIAERVGLDGLGQVDLERRIHRNQELEGLSRMSFVILQAVMKRLEERRKARLFAELGSTMKLPRSGRGPPGPRGHRAGRPRAPADDPDPRVPGAARRPVVRGRRRHRRTRRVSAVAAVEPAPPDEPPARGRRRARLVQGLAHLRRGRPRARRRAGRAPGRATSSLLAPLADGGEGTLAAIEAAGGWEWREAPAPRSARPARSTARWLLLDRRDAAVVELAEASGLSRLAPAERDPVGGIDVRDRRGPPGGRSTRVSGRIDPRHRRQRHDGRRARAPRRRSAARR